jgi:hypothetical protein
MSAQPVGHGSAAQPSTHWYQSSAICNRSYQVALMRAGLIALLLLGILALIVLT